MPDMISEVQKTIALSQADVERIEAIGTRKGLAFSPTCRMLIKERLDEIDGDENRN